MEIHKESVKHFVDSSSSLAGRPGIKQSNLCESNNRTKSYPEPGIELLQRPNILQNSTDSEFTSKGIYEKPMSSGHSNFYSNSSNLHSSEAERSRPFYDHASQPRPDSKYYLPEKHLEGYAYSQSPTTNSSSFIDNFIGDKIPAKQHFVAESCDAPDFQSKKLLKNDSSLSNNVVYASFASTSSPATSQTQDEHENESVSKPCYPVSSILPEIKSKQPHKEEDWSKSEESSETDETANELDVYTKEKKFKVEKNEVVYLDNSEDKSLKEANLENGKL